MTWTSGKTETCYLPGGRRSRYREEKRCGYECKACTDDVPTLCPDCGHYFCKHHFETHRRRDQARQVDPAGDRTRQDDRPERVPGPVGGNRGDRKVPADPADRLSLARAEYLDILRRLDGLRDPDPVQRRWAREDYDRRVRELRVLSSWYGMLAERSRRIFMARQAEYDEFWARQRRLRQDARRPGRREQSF